jgi:hypothetical protein
MVRVFSCELTPAVKTSHLVGGFRVSWDVKNISSTSMSYYN